MTVHTVCLCICDVSYIGSGSGDLRRIRSVRERLDAELNKVCDLIGVVDNDLHRLFFTKILELIEHLISRSEVKVTLHLCITEAHAHKHVLSVTSVFLVEEVRVCRGAAHHAVIVSCLNKEFIYDLNIMFIYGYRSCIGFCQFLPCKEHIVA